MSAAAPIEVRAGASPSGSHACLAVGEPVILLHPPLPAVGVSIHVGIRRRGAAE